jgi:hypothetical protein
MELLRESLGIEIQKDMVIQMCLKDPSNPFENTLIQKLITWAKMDSKVSGASRKHDLKERAHEAMENIMRKYKVINCEDCLDDLLQGDVESASIYVSKNQR